MKYPLPLFVVSCAMLCVPTTVFAATGQLTGHETKEGTSELSVAGSGVSDRDFDNNTFNMNLTYGRYVSEGNLVGIRQGVSASYEVVENDDDETNWNGSTRIFYDYHFDMDKWKPFVGVSMGYLYGETTEETWIAGPELGLKYYVAGNTFISGLMEYQFIFDDVDDADSQFDDGIFIYSLGMGYNF